MNYVNKDKVLEKLYYEQHYLVGRDKLFRYIRDVLKIETISQRYIAEWLAKQRVNQIYRNPKKQTTIRYIISSRPGSHLQIDLIDFTKRPSSDDPPFNYILNVVDVFSRKSWLQGIKDKTIKSVIPELNYIIQEIQKDNKINIIQSDSGNEFKIAFQNGIKHLYSNAHTPQNQAAVERTNGTIKKILFKYLAAENLETWSDDILLKIEDVYNSTYHTSLGMTPDEAYALDPFQITKLYENQKLIKGRAFKEVTKTLNVGDHVRLAAPVLTVKTKGRFNWSEDIYEIVKVIKGNGVSTNARYKIRNLRTERLERNTFSLSKLLFEPKK